MQAWAVTVVIKIREWILIPFKDQCRQSLGVSSNGSFLHSLLCCESPLCPGDNYCKPYVKVFVLWPISACSSMWEDLVNMWFSIRKLDDLEPSLKGAGSICGDFCQFGVSDILVHTLISCLIASLWVTFCSSGQHAKTGQLQHLVPPSS